VMGQMKEERKGERGTSIGQSTSGQQSTERAMQPAGQRELGRARSLTPFSFVRRMMDDMDRMFGGGIGGAWLEDAFAPMQVWSPQVEVFERGGNLVVRADLPGLDPKDVRIDVDDDGLIIRGERRTEHEEKREGYLHIERSYGSFQRRIPIPRGVDRNAADAVFDKGVLEITMKMPKTTAQSLPIRTASGGTGQQQQQQQPQQENGPQSAPRH